MDIDDDGYVTLAEPLGVEWIGWEYLSGWWFGCQFLFSHTLGISSSQLTVTFFRGVAQPPTSYGNSGRIGYSTGNTMIRGKSTYNGNHQLRPIMDGNTLIDGKKN